MNSRTYGRQLMVTSGDVKSADKVDVTEMSVNSNPEHIFSYTFMK